MAETLKAYNVSCVTKYKTPETRIVLAVSIPMAVSALAEEFQRHPDPIVKITSIFLMDENPVIHKQGDL